MLSSWWSTTPAPTSLPTSSPFGSNWQRSWLEITPVGVDVVVVGLSSAHYPIAISLSGWRVRERHQGTRGENVCSMLPPRSALRQPGFVGSVGCGCATMVILQGTVSSNGTGNSTFNNSITIHVHCNYLLFVTLFYLPSHLSSLADKIWPCVSSNAHNLHSDRHTW